MKGSRRLINKGFQVLTEILLNVKQFACLLCTVNENYPEYISRITYVCHKCGKQYPKIENQAVQHYKSLIEV